MINFLGYKVYLKQNFKTAMLYWRSLAEHGNPNAQYFLGVMFLNGQGVIENWTETVKWFHLSAYQGDVGAQYLFGEINLNRKARA